MLAVPVPKLIAVAAVSHLSLVLSATTFTCPAEIVAPSFTTAVDSTSVVE